MPTPAQVATFFTAVAAGEIETVEAQLVADPALISAPHHQWGYSVLHWAAMHGFCGRTTHLAGMVDCLLTHGAALDLCAAAVLDRPDDVARLLADDTAAVDRPDHTGSRPLHYAAERGGAEVVRLLLAAGADPDARNPHGQTPIELAAHPGPMKPAAAAEVVAALVASGASVTAHLAAAIGDLPRLDEALSQRPADLNGQDERGATPLHHAARNLHTETVRWLLDRGADPNVTGPRGKTARDEAEEHAWDIGGPSTVKLLVAAGARRGV